MGGDIKGALNFARPDKRTAGRRARQGHSVARRRGSAAHREAEAVGRVPSPPGSPIPRCRGSVSSLRGLVNWLIGYIAEVAPPILAHAGRVGPDVRQLGHHDRAAVAGPEAERTGHLVAGLDRGQWARHPGAAADLGDDVRRLGHDTALPWLDTKINELITWLLGWIVANGPGIAEQLLVWADMFGDWVIQTALPWLGRASRQAGPVADRLDYSVRPWPADHARAVGGQVRSVGADRHGPAHRGARRSARASCWAGSSKTAQAC